VFADTSFYYALTVRADANSEKAREIAADPTREIVTSTHVLAETMSLLTKRTSKNNAVRIGRGILTSARTQVIRPTTADLRRAWRQFSAYPDWDFDLIDAISFALMRREGIEAAPTFDAHFAQMGFTALPG